jgi:hypothetical protein
MKNRIHEVHDRLIPFFLLLAFLAGMALIQFSTPDLPDNDGFYHIKFADLMRREGLEPEFRWLPLTILNQNEFYDHHFLYHVALIPFTFGDLRLGAKWSAVIFPALSFLAVYYLFRRQRIPFAWLWALTLLAVSEAFLYRMSVTRAQSLSLGILALGMIWLLEKKHWHMTVLGFVYVWTYNAFPLLLVLGGLYSASVLMIERKIELKPLVFIAAGILVGLVINPYFPRNMIFTFRHILPKLAEPEISGLGNEWFPYTTAQLLENSLPALAALAGGALALGLAGRKIDVRTTFAFLVSLLFTFMLFRVRRFVEYFPPFALIFAAFAWSPLTEMFVESKETDPAYGRIFWKRWLIPVLLLMVAAIPGYFAISEARELIRLSKPANFYQGAAEWLQDNTPAGALVFQTDWDDFPRLFFFNTHNVYLAGLDPTYSQQYDPDLYDRWVAITRGRVENPADAILNEFGAEFVHTDLNHGDFLAIAYADSRMVEVFRDDQAVIFQIVKNQ